LTDNLDNENDYSIAEVVDMPSPFPGVDPYIEAQGRWGDFHSTFLTYCRDAIGPHLPEDYVAQVNEQVRLVHPSRGASSALYRPDIAILNDPDFPPRPARAGTGAATLEPVAVLVETEDPEEISDRWIEILKLPDLALVTVIEVLSPTNKLGNGREDYLTKRREFLNRPVHFVELDLLLGGHRLPMRSESPLGDFVAMVSRVERRPTAEVYTWSLRDPLPEIPVPLSLPDPDVWFALGHPFAMAYERGRYTKILKYEQPLPFTPTPEDRAWAEGLTRMKT
jgi:Protein of unknown function (DUF4058)